MKYILMIAIAVTAFTTGAHTASAEGFKDKVSKFQSMSNEEKAAMGQQIKSNWEGLSEEEKAAVSATVQAKGQEAIDKWNTLPAEQQQEILDAAHIKAQDTAAQAKTKCQIKISGQIWSRVKRIQYNGRELLNTNPFGCDCRFVT